MCDREKPQVNMMEVQGGEHVNCLAEMTGNKRREELERGRNTEERNMDERYKQPASQVVFQIAVRRRSGRLKTTRVKKRNQWRLPFSLIQ